MNDSAEHAFKWLNDWTMVALMAVVFAGIVARCAIWTFQACMTAWRKDDKK